MRGSGGTERAAPRLPNPLRRWQRRLHDGAGLVLLATGLAWLGVHYGLAHDGLPHPLEPWLMRLHGAGAMAALFVLGLVAGAHVPNGWRVTATPAGRRQRGLGVALCALAALLVLTGWLLYYGVSEDSRTATGWVHAAFGVALAMLAWRHRRIAR